MKLYNWLILEEKGNALCTKKATADEPAVAGRQASKLVVKKLCGGVDIIILL